MSKGRNGKYRDQYVNEIMMRGILVRCLNLVNVSEKIRYVKSFNMALYLGVEKGIPKTTAK